MAGELGLLSGLSEGIGAGVSSYLQTKKMFQDQAIKKQLANAQSNAVYGELISKAGTDVAHEQMPSLGLEQPEGLMSKQGLIPAEGRGQVSGQGLMGNQVPGAPSSEEIRETFRYANSRPENERKAILAPIMARIEGHSKLGDPRERLAFEKGHVDLKNSERKPLEDLKSEYDKDPRVSNFRVVKQVYDKIMKANPKSPSEMQALLFLIYKLENPGSVATGPVQAMKESPELFQRLLNRFSIETEGVPDISQIEDMKNMASSSFKETLKAFEEAQKYNQQSADAYGVDRGFLKEPGVEESRGLMKGHEKNKKEYEPAGKRMMKGLLGPSKSKGIRPEDRKEFDAYLKKHPKGEKSDRIRRILNER
jgi:hypothetical protein